MSGAGNKFKLLEALRLTPFFFSECVKRTFLELGSKRDAFHKVLGDGPRLFSNTKDNAFSFLCIYLSAWSAKCANI